MQLCITLRTSKSVKGRLSNVRPLPANLKITQPMPERWES
jgi:hypothetical protein